jgi:flagellar hook-associated protein 2
MAGIQLTGLYSGLNWQNLISEIIQADSAPVTALQATETTNEAKINAMNSLSTDMTSLETAAQGLADFGTNVFDGRTASMTDSTSTWTPSAGASTPTGAYAIDVSVLATESQLNGAAGISGPLSSSSNVSSLTVANMDTATPVTAGTFTVNGQQVTVALTDSLQDVFTAISTATGGNVTAAYNPSTDKVTLTSASGPVVLGAANDTSNFLQAMKLTNNGSSSTVTSTAALGSVNLSNPLASAGLKTALTGLDSSSNGSFTINGVSISYNENTSTLQDVIGSINSSGAGVTASYDAQTDSMTLVNNVTGDLGISTADTSGNLLASLGLTTAATLQHGTNAQFTVNGGPLRTSTTNQLTSTALGVAGLSVNVDSEDTQTVQVGADTTSMTNAIQSFISAYNQLTSDISTDTQITSTSGSVTTSILSGNYDVSSWGEDLRSLVFNSLPGVSGDINSLDQIGIGFSGTANTLSITDSNALQSALANDPQGVAAFFQSGSSGMVSTLSTALNSYIADDTNQQNDLKNTDSQISDQISNLQQQLAEEQQTLTTEFTAMEDAFQAAQAETATLSGSSGSSSSSSSGSTGFNSSAFSSSPSSSTTSSTSSSSSSG